MSTWVVLALPLHVALQQPPTCLACAFPGLGPVQYWAQGPRLAACWQQCEQQQLSAAATCKLGRSPERTRMDRRVLAARHTAVVLDPRGLAR